MDEEAQRLVAAYRIVEPRFALEKADQRLLNTLLAWVWRDERYNHLEVDFNKGFFFYGPLGVGKSLTMRAMQKYMNDVCQRFPSKRDDWRMKAWLKSAGELANNYAVEGQPGIIRYGSEEFNLIIDELGREPCPAKYFGTEMNVLQFVLQLRYDHRQSRVTHATTNMELGDVAKLYGAFIADRFLEMFNFIPFEGESMRN